MLQEGGITPIDQLKVGLRLEIQEELNPLNVWFVQVGTQSSVCDGLCLVLKNFIHLDHKVELLKRKKQNFLLSEKVV